MSNMTFAEGLQPIQQNGIINAEETKQTKENYSEELLKVKHIEGTPFTVVRADNNKWFIAMGQARLTDYLESEEECVNKINLHDWELLISFIARIQDIGLNEHKLINQK
ncbi:MAG: hypothetical protein [Microviridae sp.]|nr:MAG: hypothetical protein [Microviridae sp.]